MKAVLDTQLVSDYYNVFTVGWDQERHRQQSPVVFTEIRHLGPRVNPFGPWVNPLILGKLMCV